MHLWKKRGALLCILWLWVKKREAHVCIFGASVEEAGETMNKFVVYGWKKRESPFVHLWETRGCICGRRGGGACVGEGGGGMCASVEEAGGACVHLWCICGRIGGASVGEGGCICGRRGACVHLWKKRGGGGGHVCICGRSGGGHVYICGTHRISVRYLGKNSMLGFN